MPYHSLVPVLQVPSAESRSGFVLASSTTSATWVYQYTRFSATFRDVFARNGVANAQKGRDAGLCKHENNMRK
jgi:hypothetical protein